MSRLYIHVRLLTKFTLRFETKLCVSTVVNSQSTTNRIFQSYSFLCRDKLTERNPFAVTVRSFAKDKHKLKKGAPRISINDQELSEVFDVEKLYADFKIPLDYLKKVYIEQLNLRTSVNSIQDIQVKYDGNTYTVQDLAEIKKKSSKDIVLDMACFSDAIPSVMESLRNSYLHVNPAREGSSVIIQIPKITQEYRESSAKKAKVYFNKCKDSIRNVQNKYLKLLSKEEKLSVDVIFRLKAQISAIGEKQMIQAEEIYEAKEKELLSTD